MGAACCVAAKDRTIVSRPHGETLQRHVRHSPTWSFRWDNRGRVAGEETSTNWLRDGGYGNDQVDAKSGSTVEAVFASEGGSPIDSLRSFSWQKSPVSRVNAEQAISCNVLEVKGPTESPCVSHPSPVKLSPSAPSVSSVSASSSSSKSQQLPPKSTPPRWPHRSPVHQLKISDSPIPDYKSPTFSISEKAYELTDDSNGGSSGSWSIPIFSELVTTQRERWSVDSENSNFSRDKITRFSSGRNSRSPSIDLQTCGVCTKLLSERSLWGWSSQKIISTNEIAVVSVLTCGHVYHSECLEYMTPETDKFDPICPVCTYGEKRAVKMSEKALKAEMDLKGRKRFRKRVVDNNDIVLDHHKSSGTEGRGSNMSSSSSMKSSLGKPFLKRLSFGSKTSKSLCEIQSTRKKGLFWAKSSKH
ncbi:hypothetical protein BUALT_Bualt19G0119000 [Buddleja alternifolia]|uniref:RING-type domain-containing protein n=1 Tax=Buddleja alternifolia TaxID=168488 RepID=A0AAV6WBB9_9LAMI|nr:hypothetical protein BUALT_Bualt19G0119000 [Buddleja alternifolia]